jgi:hypothetical protein
MILHWLLGSLKALLRHLRARLRRLPASFLTGNSQLRAGFESIADRALGATK